MRMAKDKGILHDHAHAHLHMCWWDSVCREECPHRMELGSGRYLIPESSSRVRLAKRPATTVNVVVAGRVIPAGMAVALIV